MPRGCVLAGGCMAAVARGGYVSLLTFQQVVHVSHKHNIRVLVKL
jgi:hypothetical protein